MEEEKKREQSRFEKINSINVSRCSSFVLYEQTSSAEFLINFHDTSSLLKHPLLSEQEKREETKTGHYYMSTQLKRSQI